jgi:hypothetical protein
MKKLVLGTLLLSTSAFANLHLAPPDFNTDHGRAIFVDFQKAEYNVTFDTLKMRTTVSTKITFKALAKGKPIFDLLPEPTNLKMNGQNTTQEIVSFPGGISTLRQVMQEVEPGIHTLEMENRFKENVIYWPLLGRVSSAFWIRDLKERKFLEQYVPSNFEFDQYKIVMNIKFAGTKKSRQDIYSNGVVTQTSPTTYRIEFPEYFTVSCPYFHTTPKGRMRRLDFSYPSISGRHIPITVYSPFKSRTKRFKKETIRVMAELEADYGAWAHPGFVAYGTMPGTGGMEHSGATQTSFGALDHEMLHSYFAKGIMPANGASGWIDEAIASWRDKGYPRLPDPGFGGSNIGGHSVYQRHTDNRSYALGSAFMAYLDWRLQDMGGLKAFLKGYFAAYKHQVVTTEHFKNNLEFFSGIKMDSEFDTFIFGKSHSESHSHEENPVHKALSKSQLLNLL